MTSSLLHRGMLRFGLVYGLILIVLAGCNGAATPAISPTAVAPSSLPPSSTPTPATAEPTATPQVRATLPPTWTPQGGATDTPPPMSQVQMVPATPVVCNAFVIDRIRSTESFRVGNTATVYWTPIESVTRYRVRLFDAQLNDLLIDYTQAGQFTFAANLFQVGVRYGWEIIPENAVAQQMCFAIGGDLVPGP